MENYFWPVNLEGQFYNLKSFITGWSYHVVLTGLLNFEETIVFLQFSYINPLIL